MHRLEPTFHIKNLVIGGGIVGLAVGARLARSEFKKYESIVSNAASEHRRTLLSTLVLEKNHLFGEEVSSRNSEVIHAGLYYPIGSLKSQLCISGNASLYRLADKYAIPYRKCGKWIVAQDDQEVRYLQDMLLRLSNEADHYEYDGAGSPSLRFLSHSERLRKEPLVHCVEALESETSGIIDSHLLMRFFLYALTRDGSGDLVCNTRVKYIEAVSEGDPDSAFLVYTEDPPCWIGQTEWSTVPVCTRIALP